MNQWRTDEHLVHDDAQRPPVALWAVALLLEHFGRDVVGRADSRVGELAAVCFPRGDLLLVGEVNRDGGGGTRLSRLVLFKKLLRGLERRLKWVKSG